MPRSSSPVPEAATGHRPSEPREVTVTDYTAADAAAPIGVPAEPIEVRQASQDMVELVRAASVTHRRGQWIEAVRIAVAVAMAIGGIVTAITGEGRIPFSVIGAGWFFVSVLVLKGWAARTARQGALLQEMFDVSLFYLPWRGTLCGDPVRESDVLRLATGLKLDSARDLRITDGWYDSTTGVHHPYDVFIAQEQNLQWDSRLRRGYSLLVAGVAGTWAVIGVLASIVIARTTVTTALVAFFIPSFAAFQLAHEIYTGQRRIAAERDRLANALTEIFRTARPGTLTDAERTRLREQARNIQDGIFRTRLDVTRVPQWFYRWHRRSDEHDFATVAERHRLRLAGPAP
jgi:hypothetical protein